jgi:SnoaL-like protein
MSQIKRGTTAEQLVSETDHVQLSRLVNEHAWRADNGRADTIHDLYTDDGELIIGPTPLRGRAAILEWGRQLVKNPPWRSIRHVCGNMRFVSGGPDEAEGTTILTVFMAAGSETATTQPFSVGEDHDLFVRTEEGWRFVSRRWVELFARGDVLNLPQEANNLP